MEVVKKAIEKQRFWSFYKNIYLFRLVKVLEFELIKQNILPFFKVE